MPTVYIVDDDIHVRESLQALVGTMVGVRCQAFSSAEDFLAARSTKEPGCLVTDVRLRGLSGLELQEELRRRNDHIPVVVVSAYSETPMTVRAMKTGAVTFLDKPCRSCELVDAIRDGLALDESIREELSCNEVIQETFASLNEREYDVLKLLLEGKKNKAIAEALDISVRTVENRRHSILEKTNANSIAQLAQLHQQAFGTSSVSRPFPRPSLYRDTSKTP